MFLLTQIPPSLVPPHLPTHPSFLSKRCLAYFCESFSVHNAVGKDVVEKVIAIEDSIYQGPVKGRGHFQDGQGLSLLTGLLSSQTIIIYCSF